MNRGYHNLLPRLLDAMTQVPDLLEDFVCRYQDFQTPRPLQTYVPMMRMHSTRGRPTLPSAAPLLGGSALRAARMKASSVCEISSNEQK